MCLRVSAPQAIKTNLCEMKSEYCVANQRSPTFIQFLRMALAIDTVDGRGLSNKVHRVLLPKKSKVMLYIFAVHFTVKAV